MGFLSSFPFNKVTGYKIHIQESVVFLYTNNTLPEKDIVLLFILRLLERERYVFSQFILHLHLYFFTKLYFKIIKGLHAPIPIDIF